MITGIVAGGLVGGGVTPITEWGFFLDPWDEHAGAWMSLATASLYESTDGTGTDEAASATVTASHQDGTNPVTNINDGNSATSYFTGTGARPNWVKFTLPAGKEIRSVKLTARTGFSGTGPPPTNIRFGYWTGGVFVTVGVVHGLAWTSGETKTFTLADRTALPSKVARYHRLVSLRNYQAWNSHQLSECHFRSSVAGSKLTGTYSVSSGTNAANLGDENFSTFWNGTGTSANVGRTETITLDLGAGNDAEVVEMALANRLTFPDYATGDFYVQYSHDNANWYYNWHEFAFAQAGYSDNTLRIFTRP